MSTDCVDFYQQIHAHRLTAEVDFFAPDRVRPPRSVRPWTGVLCKWICSGVVGWSIFPGGMATWGGGRINGDSGGPVGGGCFGEKAHVGEMAVVLGWRRRNALKTAFLYHHRRRELRRKSCESPETLLYPRNSNDQPRCTLRGGLVKFAFISQLTIISWRKNW